MRILIFGGTTEGRILAEQLAKRGAEITVSVATDEGAEMLSPAKNITVITGRLDRAAMEQLLPGFDRCIDATHPYAAEVTKNIRAACRAAGIPLRRLLRPESSTDGCVLVPSCAAAADYLLGRPGNILLTTGSKELSAFSALPKEQLFVRVLPTHGGISACEALGLPHRNILAMQGPFSQKLNEAVLEQYDIRYLVTKDGGDAGGFREKRAAAKRCGAELILVGRPPDEGSDMDTILTEIQEAMGCM